MEANNVKAMREAVVDIKTGLAGKMEQRPALMTPHEVAILKRCEAALAAPPRNCDKFDDLNSAQRYYIEHGCPKGLGKIVDGEIRKTPWKSQFEKWLFATATPANGGAK